MRRPLALLFAAILALHATPAHPHPLGNFTINHYARLEPRTGFLALTLIYDMAEIPTFQAMDRLDPNGDGRVSAAERAQYARATAPGLLRDVHLACDGAGVPLQLRRQTLAVREGQGGLPTLRWALHLEAAYPPDARRRARLELRDDSFAGRLGWREMVVRTGQGVTLRSASVPPTERSLQLTAYPADLLQDPLDERRASCVIERAASVPPAGGAAEIAPLAAPRPLPVATASPRAASGHARPATPSDRFADLIAHRTLTWQVVLVSLLLAVGLGALHALSPGHGKTVVAAYLVGSRGTARHALFLGLVITATHTFGVFALGLVTLGASRWIMTEALYPWLGFASGILVALIGGLLFHERVEQLIGRTAEHRHLFWRHAHVPPAAAGGSDAALDWRSLAGLGVSGGLVPCPSAIVVMLSAISLHRIGFGMVLIAAFSLGLALVLVSLGVLFVHGARLLPRGGSGGWVLRVAPLGSAIVVAGLGLAMAVQSLVAGGVLALHV